MDRMGLKTYDRGNKDLRCPNNHPMWQLYMKRIKGTTETIVCCRSCDALPEG